MLNSGPDRRVKAARGSQTDLGDRRMLSKTQTIREDTSDDDEESITTSEMSKSVHESSIYKHPGEADADISLLDEEAQKKYWEVKRRSKDEYLTTLTKQVLMLRQFK